MNKLREYIRIYLSQRQKTRRIATTLTVLSGILVFITVYTLILPALALEKEAFCGQEEHEHSNACYDQVLVCDQEEHIHTEDCYDEDGNLTCEKSEHTHDDSCYKETLACGKERHVHTRSCYQKPEPFQLKDSFADSTGLWYQVSPDDQETDLATGQEIIWKKAGKKTTLDSDGMIRLHLAFKLKKDALSTTDGEAVYVLPDNISITQETADWLNDEANAVNQVISGTATPEKVSTTEEYLAGTWQLVQTDDGKWQMEIKWDPYALAENAKDSLNVWTDLYLTGRALLPKKDGSYELVLAKETGDHDKISVIVAGVSEEKEAASPEANFTESEDEMVSTASNGASDQQDISSETQKDREIYFSDTGNDSDNALTETEMPAGDSREKTVQDDTTEEKTVRDDTTEEKAVQADTDEEKTVQKKAAEEETASTTADLAEQSNNKSEQPDNMTEQSDTAAEPSDDKIEQTLTYSGEDYTITAAFGNDAKLPEDTRLDVREIREDSANREEQKEYQNYYRQTQSAMHEKFASVKDARFFDITFISGQKEVEPSAPVNVKIEYNKPETIASDTDISAIHLPENADTEILDVEIGSDRQGIRELEFSSDSFSVYGIVYTVDYAYVVDGISYNFSMTGNGTIKLSELFRQLHIEEDVHDVDSVDFTDDTLLEITPDWHLGIIGSYDWTIKSRKPFSTDETLTIVMKDGTVYQIRVTDAQEYTVTVNFKEADGSGSTPTIDKLYIYASIKKGDGTISYTHPAMAVNRSGTYTMSQFNNNVNFEAGDTVTVYLLQSEYSQYINANSDGSPQTGNGITIYENGSVVGDYEVSVTSTSSSTDIVCQKPQPYTYTIKAMEGDSDANITFTEGPWYLYAEVARADGTYFYVRKIEGNGPVSGTIDHLERYTGVNQKQGTTIPSNTDFVTFALLRPKDSGQADQPGYFWTADHMNVKALSGSSVDNMYTLKVEPGTHHSDIILQKGTDASITLHSYDAGGNSEQAPDLTAEGSYFVMGQLSFRDGLEDKTCYYVQKWGSGTSEVSITTGFRGGALANKSSNETHYLTGTRSFEPTLVYVPGNTSITADEVISKLISGSSDIVVYRNNSAVESYRMTTVDGTLDEPNATIELKKLPKLNVAGEVYNTAGEKTGLTGEDHYYLLAEIDREGTKAYAYQPLNISSDGTMSAAPIDSFRTTDGKTWYYAEEDTLNYYVVKGNINNINEAIASDARYAENQLMGNYTPSFRFDEATNTLTTILKETQVPTGTAYDIRIDMMSKEQDKVEPADPSLTDNYYVLAYLTPKGSGSKGQVIGWYIMDVDEAGLNNGGTYTGTIPADGFNVCNANLDANGEKIGYNADAYDLNLRMYHSAQKYSTYKEVREHASDASPDKYDFTGVFTKEKDSTIPENTSVIRLHKAYDKEYGLRVYVDHAGLSIPEGDYIVRVTLEHETSGVSYAFARLKVDASTGGDTPQLLEFIGDDQGRIWRDGQNAGIIKNENDANYKFTGNEKGVKIDILALTPSNNGDQFGEWIKSSTGQGATKNYTLVNYGDSINMYTVSLGSRETDEDVTQQKGYIYDVIRFTEDVAGVSKGTIDEYLETASDFGLYTEILSKHATDMEANIGADRLTGEIGADYGFSDNNIKVNRINVLKRYYQGNEPWSGKTVTLKLYPVESYDENTGAYTTGTAISPNAQKSKTTTDSDGVAEIVFDKLPAGRYVLKELMADGREYTWDPSGVTKASDGTEIHFSEQFIEIDDVNQNINYFGTVSDSVQASPVVTHSRNGWIIVGDEHSYTRLKSAADASSGFNGRVSKAGSEEYPKTYDIRKDMEELRDLSVLLGGSGNSKTVRIINATLAEMNGREYLPIKDDGRYVVVNIDMSDASSVETVNLDTYIDGHRLMADFGAGGNEDSSKVLYNFIVKDSKGNISPYTGKINTMTQASGILLAPSAIVADLGGNWGGTIICHEAQHTGSEIHSDSANKIQNKNTLLTNGTPEAGDLKLTKSFKEATTDRTTWFIFEVTAKKADGTPLSGEFVASGLKEGNKVTFDSQGKAKVLVRAQNSVTITGLPVGTVCEVKELTTAETEHFTTDSMDPQDGKQTIEKSKVKEVEVINKKAQSELEIPVTKTWVDGNTGGNTQIQYTLYRTTTAPQYVTVNLTYKGVTTNASGAQETKNFTKDYQVMKGSKLRLLMDHAWWDASSQYTVACEPALSVSKVSTNDINIKYYRYSESTYEMTVPENTDVTTYNVKINYGKDLEASDFLEPVVEVIPPAGEVVPGYENAVLSGSSSAESWTKTLKGLPKYKNEEDETEPYYYYIYEKSLNVDDGEDVKRYESTYNIINKNAAQGEEIEVTNRIRPAYTWLEITKRWDTERDFENGSVNVVLYRRLKGTTDRPVWFDQKVIKKMQTGYTDKEWTDGWYMLDGNYDYFVFESTALGKDFQDDYNFGNNTSYWQVYSPTSRTKLQPLEGYTWEETGGYYVPVDTTNGGQIEIVNKDRKITFTKTWADAVDGKISIGGTEYTLDDLKIEIQLQRYVDGVPEDNAVTKANPGSWEGMSDLYDVKTLDGEKDTLPTDSRPSAYEDENWTYIWTNLPDWDIDKNNNNKIVFYTYAVKEISVKAGDTDLTNFFVKVPSEPGYETIGLTNTLNETSITVEKQWDPVPNGIWTATFHIERTKKQIVDAEGNPVENGTWDSEWEIVTKNLKEESLNVQVTNRSPDYKEKVSSLPKYFIDTDGAVYEYKYRATEAALECEEKDNYNAKLIQEGTSENDYAIIVENSYSAEEGETYIRVEKNWSDGNANHEGDSVNVQLYKYYGAVVEMDPDDVILTANVNWSGYTGGPVTVTFTGTNAETQETTGTYDVVVNSESAFVTAPKKTRMQENINYTVTDVRYNTDEVQSATVPAEVSVVTDQETGNVTASLEAVPKTKMITLNAEVAGAASGSGWIKMKYEGKVNGSLVKGASGTFDLNNSTWKGSVSVPQKDAAGNLITYTVTVDSYDTSVFESVTGSSDIVGADGKVSVTTTSINKGPKRIQVLVKNPSEVKADLNLNIALSNWNYDTNSQDWSGKIQDGVTNQIGYFHANSIPKDGILGEYVLKDDYTDEIKGLGFQAQDKISFKYETDASKPAYWAGQGQVLVFPPETTKITITYIGADTLQAIKPTSLKSLLFEARKVSSESSSQASTLANENFINSTDSLNHPQGTPVDNGSETLNNSNKWRRTWTKLPMKELNSEDGKIHYVYYYVEETSVTSTAKKVTATYSETKKDDRITGVTITNTPEYEQGSLTITKTWEGLDSADLTVAQGSFSVAVEGKDIGGSGVDEITLSWEQVKDGWTKSDLPAGETYTVTESVGEDAVKDYRLTTDSVTGGSAITGGTINLVNRYEKVRKVTVTKIWHDQESTVISWPQDAEITITLNQKLGQSTEKTDYILKNGQILNPDSSDASLTTKTATVGGKTLYYYELEVGNLPVNNNGTDYEYWFEETNTGGYQKTYAKELSKDQTTGEIKTTGKSEDAKAISGEYIINRPEDAMELPHTGGIGTSIFYLAGMILTLGAATILLARRKA